MGQRKIKVTLNKDTQKVVSAKVNPWGFHFIDKNTIQFSWNEQVMITIQGGVHLMPTDRLEVSIKCVRIPQLAVSDVFRNKVDLMSDNRVESVVFSISEKIKVNKAVVRDAIYSLTERLEQYRNYLLNEKEVQPLEMTRGQSRTSTELKRVLNSKTTTKEIDKLISTVGYPGQCILKTLYSLVFSRITNKPQHIVLIGDAVKCSEILNNLCLLLPKEEYVKTNALQEKEVFGQKHGYWNHKVIIGQNLSNLSDRSYLYRFLLEGEVFRLAQGRQKEQKTNGPVQLIGFSTTGNHSFLNSPSVICIEIDELSYNQESMKRQLEIYAGTINQEDEDTAVKLLKEFQKIDAPVAINNAYLEKLDLIKLFVNSPDELTQFLSLSVTHAIARRQWDYVCNVEPRDMIRSCAVLKNTWSNSVGLSWQVEDTYSKALELSNSKNSFTSSELRKLTEENPKNTERHLKTLLEKGFLERVNGDRYTGYKYAVTSKTVSDTIQWDELIQQLNKL